MLISVKRSPSAVATVGSRGTELVRISLSIGALASVEAAVSEKTP